jgi:hypothetical protein
MVFAGSSPITTTSPSSKAHQKSGPFPQTSITRLQRSYDPVRLPPWPPPFATSRPLTSPLTGLPPVSTNHPTDVPCPLPRRIAWVRVSIASPHVRPSPNDRRVGIRIRTFEACSGFTLLRPIGSLSSPRPPQLPGRAACQLADQSTFIRVRPFLTDSSRPRAARSFASFPRCRV